MKKIITIIVLLVLSKSSFCQVNLRGTEDHLVTFSMGLDKTFITNPAFDSWTALNYNKKIGYFMGGMVDINIVLKSYDFGVYLSAGYPYLTGSSYWGRRLTSLQSKISSFLNLKIGTFIAYPNVSPVNYVPTHDQQGKQLELRYEAAYIGLSSKNYLNKLSFRTGKGKKAVSWNSGFYVDFGYEPWNGDWQYGYYKGSGKYSQFISNRIYSIPNLSNEFINIGIFIGFGS
jgi:hypothetical protein